jgi:signal transduction histidine kinase/CheY-like chemotaxis protein
MSWSILSVMVRQEQDVVTARQRARQLADLLGFDRQMQTRIATAVSEIARNAFHYGGGGVVEFAIEGQTAPQVLLIRIRDQGPGIPNLAEILAGRYQSSTGMGMGIVGAQRLMDRFHIDTAPGRGTTVWLRKIFPKQAPLVTTHRLQQLADALAHQRTHDPLAEIQRQNQELMQALTELRQRQEELQRLNRELEDTNRGVVALYAELDEKADHLRRADEMKTRFLSNMSHEFRTPLNSQLALTRLLLDRTDGELTAEQEKQIRFIRQGTNSLLELVNDLLDLAKIEAGKTEVHPVEFTVATLFSALRGMLRPLLVSDTVNLHFDDPSDLPTFYTDEGKVSQILRNFLSNALKFTERGEVRVSATLTPDRQAVVFAVADTGIGIAAEDHQRIFEEFTQLENPLQKRVKGTGLGLPLCRKLAELLGGTVAVQSTVGVGSTFLATSPLVYRTLQPEESLLPASAPSTPVSQRGSIPVLVIEDSDELLFLYQKYLTGTVFQVLPVRSLRDARRAMAQVRPRAIILDILLRGEDAWHFLAEMKSDPDTSIIPILVVTDVEDPQKGLALGADAYCVKPVEPAWLLEQLQQMVTPAVRKILVIDDQEATRYLMRKLLDGRGYDVLEAADGRTGIQMAQREAPHLVCLDLSMPEISGWTVLQHLQDDPRTQSIPVVVITSLTLTEGERQQLAAQHIAFLSKSELSRKTLCATIRRSLDDVVPIGEVP